MQRLSLTGESSNLTTVDCDAQFVDSLTTHFGPLLQEAMLKFRVAPSVVDMDEITPVPRSSW